MADVIFRCTYCDRVIARSLTKADLHLGPDEEFVPGKLYNYAGCWCGWSKHVICEVIKGEHAAETGGPDDDH